MAPTIAAWLRGLDALKDASDRGGVAGLQAERGRVIDAMRSSDAHGTQTGATKASYQVAVVGAGLDGGAEAAEAFAAVAELNPGHVGRSSVDVEGVGVLLYSGTNYQDKLETEGKAVLEPTLQSENDALTAAYARGSRRVLGGG
jgi:hypothetical protein